MAFKRTFLLAIVVAGAAVPRAVLAEDAASIAREAQGQLTECYTTAIQVLDEDAVDSKDEVVESVLAICRPKARRYAHAALAVVGGYADEAEDALQALEDEMTPRLLDEIEYQRGQREDGASPQAGGD